MVASPAPTVSATFTLIAGRETLPPRVKIVAPSLPRVSRTRRASAASQSAASSSMSLPGAIQARSAPLSLITSARWKISFSRAR